MGKLNINDLKKSTELKTSEQTETKVEPAELINNTTEAKEDINEISKDTENKAENKVIVRYIGGGVWKDSRGKLWSNTDKTQNILSERPYSESEYEEREDLKFMVSYGAMKVTHV